MGFLVKLLSVLVVVISVLVGVVVINMPKAPDDMTHARSGCVITAVRNVITAMTDSVGPLLGMGKLQANRKFAAAQQKLSGYFRTDHPNVTNREEVFDGVPVRVYDPVYRKTGGPAIMFFHGGGWVFYYKEVYHTMVEKMALETGFLVVSVDYRLAPEHRYPAALLDCETATQFLISHHKQYNIHPKRIALVGDSAGGNLAAALTLLMRDKNRDIMPKLQVLIYPVLQALDLTLPSYQNATGIILDPKDMASYMTFYLLGTTPEPHHHEIVEKALSKSLYSNTVWQKHGHKIAYKMLPKENFQQNFVDIEVPKNAGFSDELDKLVVEPSFSPLMEENLENLPQALFLTCKYDILRDDSFLYMYRLKKAGVKVDHFHDTCYHGVLAVVVDDPLMIKTCAYLRDQL